MFTHGDRAPGPATSNRSVGCSRAWTAPSPAPVVRDATVTDTDALLREVGYSAAEIATLREKGVAA